MSHCGWGRQGWEIVDTGLASVSLGPFGRAYGIVVAIELAIRFLRSRAQVRLRQHADRAETAPNRWSGNVSAWPMNSSTQWTIARTLRRHFTAAADVAGWWWGEFQPTERWLRTGADLGVLADIAGGHLRTERPSNTQPTSCGRSARRIVRVARATQQPGPAQIRALSRRGDDRRAASVTAVPAQCCRMRRSALAWMCAWISATCSRGLY